MIRTSIRRAVVPGIAVLAIALTGCGASNESSNGSASSDGSSSSGSLSGELAGGGSSAQDSAQQAWRRQDDRLRPLLQAGRHQAQRLIPMLAAYDVTRIVSSSSTRCVETVGPYSDTTGWKLELEDGLSEEEATAQTVTAVVDELAHGDEGAVLCSHRPVLPTIFDALGVPDPELAAGEMLVAHLRRGTVVATELQRAH